MKVLLLNDYGTPTGGAEVMTQAIRDGLRQRGHDARLFTSCARPEGAASAADDECFGTLSGARTLLQAANPSAALHLRRVLRRFEPDVVHVTLFLTQLSPLILPVLRDVPSLYYAVWYRAVCPLGTKMLPDGSPCQVRWGAPCYQNGCLPLRDWAPLMAQMTLWRRWRAAFDLFVADSHAVRERLEAEDITPVEVVWHGTPVRPARAALGDAPTAVFAGRLVREKGADVLVRAFAQVQAQIPSARLLVAGDGAERARLETLARQTGVAPSVSMLGHLSREEMRCAFDGAWVQVVPSRWAEPFGIVAAEAMMRGTAVIASDTGGLREVVLDGETGLRVPPDDAEALAAALLRLLGDRHEAERMGRAGRARALAEFTEDHVVDQFVRLYERLRKSQLK